MKARNILVSDIRFDPGAGGYKGRVSLSLTGGPVRLLVDFHCRAYLPSDCPATLVIHGLIKDAMRQAHDLPTLRKLPGTISPDLDGLRVEAA